MRSFYAFIILVLAALAPEHARADASTLSETVLSAMLKLSPPGKHGPPLWEDSPEGIRARYESIAADIAAVSIESARGDAWQARLFARYLVAVAYHESGLRRDVDEGECYQGDGKKWCDFDATTGEQTSEGLWQLKRARHLRGDRHAQAALALSRIKGSLWTCRDQAPENQLSAYARGNCEMSTAHAVSQALFGDIKHTADAGL